MPARPSTSNRERTPRSVAAKLAFLHRNTSGVTAVEFALIVPVMLLMFVGIADLGIGIYTNMEVQNAAQYGTEYALLKGYDANAITTAVTGSTGLSHITVTPAQYCGCPSGEPSRAAIAAPPAPTEHGPELLLRYPSPTPMRRSFHIPDFRPVSG